MKNNKKTRLIAALTTTFMAFGLSACGGNDSNDRMDLRVDNRSLISDNNSNGYRLCRGNNSNAGGGFNGGSNFSNSNYNTNSGGQIQIEYSSNNGGNGGNFNNNNFNGANNNNNLNGANINGNVQISISIAQGMNFGNNGDVNRNQTNNQFAPTNTNGYFLNNFNVSGVNSLFISAQECQLTSINESDQQIDGRVECNLANFGGQNVNPNFNPNDAQTRLHDERYYDERYPDNRNPQQDFQTNLQRVELNFSCRKN